LTGTMNSSRHLPVRLGDSLSASGLKSSRGALCGSEPDKFNRKIALNPAKFALCAA
jgi:hypothetical protein